MIDFADHNLQHLVQEANASGLALSFSLQHDFLGAWHRFVAGTADFTATVKRDHFPYFTLGTDIVLSAVQLYAIQDNQLEFVTPQGLNLLALTEKLKTDGACDISLAPDAVLVRNDQANVFLLIQYSLGSV
jgi:hypothetical protein